MEPTAELKRAVRKYKEGKAEAFTQLYGESSKYIYTCIYKVMSGNDNVQNAVCDIMQDTYVEISRNIAQLDNENSFLSWAGTIATRKCYAWLKKNKKYVLLNEEDDTFEKLADDDNIIPEEVMQDREKQRLVREIINTQLTEMQKLCIIAFYYNDQKQSEIAQELGIPENTVKTNLSRAKAKMKAGVLDLEKKQNTRLYSVAPLLLLLFKEDVLACTVPPSVTTAVNSSVSAAGKMGIKHLFAKIAEASARAKVTAGIIGAGAVITAGSVAYVAMQDKSDSWEKENRRILTEDGKAEGSDLNDFEEDGIPEPVILEEETESENGQNQEVTGGGETVILSDKEQRDLEVLASMLSLNSYFYGGDMYGSHYPVDDVSVNMKLIDILGNMGLTDSSYTEYLPPTETDAATLIRYCRADDVRSYLKNVFGMENADISAFCEGDRAVFHMVADFVLADAAIDNVEGLPDGTYKIAGTFSLWITTDIMEAAYPYELTVIKNDDSPFGFRVVFMEFGEEVTGNYEQEEQEEQEGQEEQEEQTAGDGMLRDILLNPEGNSAYYPQEAEYEHVLFALVDIDKDGEDEILLGSADEISPYWGASWVTIFNILKYNRSSGEVSDYDGDMVYKPLDAHSWHYYDTGILLTMAEVGKGHTNCWNLLTGEFTDTEAVNPDYAALTSGNEIPVVWCEVNQENVEALVTNGSVMPVYIPTPYGRYKANGGTELEFFSDNTVLVSEGNSSKKCAFTIDGAGNIVIDPDGEAVEGTYDAQADEIRIYALKFRR